MNGRFLPIALPSQPLERITAQLRASGCVFAEEEAAVLIAAAQDNAELEVMVEQRVAGQRLEHIVGWVDFAGIRVAVGPGVFLPRPRSEFLVEQAVAVTPRGGTVVDLCCGSGALGAALAERVKDIHLYAADIDPAEVVWARKNLARWGAHVYEGDLFEALPIRLKGKIDTIVANVPYVPTGAIELLSREARLHEPRVAFDGGEDGLAIARRVARLALDWLAKGGGLLIETSVDQAPKLAAVFADNHLSPKVIRSEELNATVVIGVR